MRAFLFRYQKKPAQIASQTNIPPTTAPITTPVEAPDVVWAPGVFPPLSVLAELVISAIGSTAAVVGTSADGSGIDEVEAVEAVEAVEVVEVAEVVRGGEEVDEVEGPLVGVVEDDTALADPPPVPATTPSQVCPTGQQRIPPPEARVQSVPAYFKICLRSVLLATCDIINVELIT